MYEYVNRLLLYGDMGEDEILRRMSNIFYDWKEQRAAKTVLIRRIYDEIKKILDIGTTYGFDGNLWQNYLTFFMVNNENSFSLTCERGPLQEGSVNKIALADMEIFRKLFCFDFSEIERDLGISCFSEITDYRAIEKREQVYQKDVSLKIRNLSQKLSLTESAGEMLNVITDYYKNDGLGIFGFYRAFRIKENNGDIDFIPVSNADKSRLSDLVGYESQKKKLTDNTEAFLLGKAANNVLLYGDSGTGKSSSVKALMNEYGDRGLRLIEIYKYQFKLLSPLISRIKKRNYRFIIYMDDLSFEAEEVEYKFLKAVMEGGVETKPDNVLLYATSNRRNLIRETWNDRNDMEIQNDIHRSDTMEEKLSLAARFGVLIGYMRPDREEFYKIVEELAKRHPEIKLSGDELKEAARLWERRHHGVSGRAAQQFINDLMGKMSF